MKNPAAQALGKLGGEALARSYPHAHFVAIGQKGAAGNQALREDGRRYRELDALGLLPSEDRIAAARKRAAK